MRHMQQNHEYYQKQNIDEDPHSALANSNSTYEKKTNLYSHHQRALIILWLSKSRIKMAIKQNDQWHFRFI